MREIDEKLHHRCEGKILQCDNPNRSGSSRQVDRQSFDWRVRAKELEYMSGRNRKEVSSSDKSNARDSDRGHDSRFRQIESSHPKSLEEVSAEGRVERRQNPRFAHQIVEPDLASPGPGIVCCCHDVERIIKKKLRFQIVGKRSDDACNKQIYFPLLKCPIGPTGLIGRGVIEHQMTNHAWMPSSEPVDDGRGKSGSDSCRGSDPHFPR